MSQKNSDLPLIHVQRQVVYCRFVSKFLWDKRVICYLSFEKTNIHTLCIVISSNSCYQSQTMLLSDTKDPTNSKRHSRYPETEEDFWQLGKKKPAFLTNLWARFPLYRWDKALCGAYSHTKESAIPLAFSHTPPLNSLQPPLLHITLLFLLLPCSACPCFSQGSDC